MQNTRLYIQTVLIVLITGGALIFSGCKEEEIYPETRLFRPVLSEELMSVDNTIIVHLGKLKRAVSYTIEVSRDTFNTIEYTIESDTNYVVLDNVTLNGDPLLWNTLYQVRATAHAEDSQYDSKISDLGAIRTQRFPTVMNLPASYDVTDTEARITWTVSGPLITRIVVFVGLDVKLLTPVSDFHIPIDDQQAGETFIDGLDPSTHYLVAIYSGSQLRGWADYTTLDPDIDPAAPGVVDIRADEDPQAVANAVAAAAEGSVILVKRGVFYDLPSTALNKSVTIVAAHGFGKQKARLYTSGNWNIAGGSTIDHIRFIDLELRGQNFAANYVFNPNANDIYVGEVLFENCEIKSFRGVMRIRGTNFIVDNYKIVNCVVDSIRDYALFTADSNPNATNPTATVNNIVLENSTFNHMYTCITSRNNSVSVKVESCTFANFLKTGSYMFRYSGGAGNNNVSQGISIRNSLFGHAWDEAGTKSYTIRGKDGLSETTFDIASNFSTINFDVDNNYEIPGLEEKNYTGTEDDLWLNADAGNFNFKDKGFIGRFSTGDPRWRVKP